MPKRKKKRKGKTPLFKITYCLNADSALSPVKIALDSTSLSAAVQYQWRHRIAEKAAEFFPAYKMCFVLNCCVKRKYKTTACQFLQLVWYAINHKTLSLGYVMVLSRNWLIFGLRKK